MRTNRGSTVSDKFGRKWYQKKLFFTRAQGDFSKMNIMQVRIHNKSG